MSEFNIFSILGVERKEVIMCRFLAFLLEPKGHCNGTDNLYSFISEVLKFNIDNSDNSKNNGFGWSKSDCQYAWIETEHYIDDNGRRIDIVIASPDKFIPIEVKIDAGFQPYQLFDYWKYSEKMNHNSEEACVWYLTRYEKGILAEDICGDREGNRIPDNRVKHISYDSLIRWAENILKNTNNDRFRETLEQYIKTLNRIINTENRKDRADYLDRRPELIKKIFTRLENRIKEEISGLEPGDEEHYMRYDKCVQQYGTKGFSERNIDILWPGINYRLPDVEPISICDGKEDIALFLRIEVYKKLWIGVVAYKYNKDSNKEEKQLDGNKKCKSMWDELHKNYDLSDLVSIEALEVQKNWNVFLMCEEYNNDPSRKTGNNVPDFQHMNDSAIKLFNDSCMETFVESIVKSIKKNIYDGETNKILKKKVEKTGEIIV